MRADAIQAGVPEPIVDWVVAWPATGRPHYRERLARFVSYWRQHPDDMAAAKAWRRVAKAALNPDALISFFMLMPDEPTTQPFPAVFGRRTIDPEAEKRQYKRRLEQVRGILELLSYHRREFKELLSDAAATPEGARAAIEYRAVDQGVAPALRRLATLLEKVDPFAKIPTKHWLAQDAAAKVYATLVADLARHLRAPTPWTAIATLANINCGACTLTASALQKIYERKDDKTG